MRISINNMPIGKFNINKCDLFNVGKAMDEWTYMTRDFWERSK